GDLRDDRGRSLRLARRSGDAACGTRVAGHAVQQGPGRRVPAERGQYRYEDAGIGGVLNMSVFELKMPKLGESVTEGTIGKWLKQPGEKVEKYDLLVEVQTDKVNTEIPSPVAGTLKDVKVQEGDTVPIGALLATFETADAAGAGPDASGDGKATASPAASEAPAPRASGAAGSPAPAANSA